mmetsp:Transcript_83621/g.249488  ORF Transcript_83621/g.249488 Transcript_83621/m.249488 type:complete len:203 (+) Transcript_83621:866-1474(+)
MISHVSPTPAPGGGMPGGVGAWVAGASCSTGDSGGGRVFGGGGGASLQGKEKAGSAANSGGSGLCFLRLRCSSSNTSLPKDISRELPKRLGRPCSSSSAPIALRSSGLARSAFVPTKKHTAPGFRWYRATWTQCARTSSIELRLVQSTTKTTASRPLQKCFAGSVASAHVGASQSSASHSDSARRMIAECRVTATVGKYRLA